MKGAYSSIEIPKQKGMYFSNSSNSRRGSDCSTMDSSLSSSSSPIEGRNKRRSSDPAALMLKKGTNLIKDGMQQTAKAATSAARTSTGAMQKVAATTSNTAKKAATAGRAIPKKGAAYSIELSKQPVIYLSKSTDSLTALGRRGFASFGSPNAAAAASGRSHASPKNWSRHPPAEKGSLVGLVLKGKSSGSSHRRRSIRPLADSVNSSITMSTCSSVRSSITLSDFGDQAQDDWFLNNNDNSNPSLVGPPALAREVSTGSDSLPLRPLRRVSDCRWNNSSSHGGSGASVRSSTSSITLSMVESIAEEEESCDSGSSESDDDEIDEDRFEYDNEQHQHYHCQHNHSHDDHCVARSYTKKTNKLTKKSSVLGFAASGVASAASFATNSLVTTATTAANVGLATTQMAAGATMMVGKTALDTTVEAGKLAANTTQRAAGATILVGKTALDTTVEAGKLAANTTQAAALGAGKLAANATKTALDTTGATVVGAATGARRLSVEKNILGTKRSSLRSLVAGAKMTSGFSSRNVVDDHTVDQEELSKEHQVQRPQQKNDSLPARPGRRESIVAVAAAGASAIGRRLSAEANILGKKRSSRQNLMVGAKTTSGSSSLDLVEENIQIDQKESSKDHLLVLQPGMQPEMNDSLPSQPGRRESVAPSCAETSAGDLLPRKPGRKASLDNSPRVAARQA